MPERAPETPNTATDGRLGARARSIAWVFGVAWDATPALVTGIVGITLIRSLIPAALAWVAKSLIDALTTEIGSSTPSLAEVMPWLWVGLLLAGTDAVASSARSYLGRRLADDLDLKVTTDVLTLAATLDIEFFENISSQDSLERAKQTTGTRFMILLNHTFGTINSTLQVISLAVVLIVIQPWTLLVVALIAPPFLLIRWMLARRHYAHEYNRATKHRWTRYFVNLLTQHQAVAETRLLGLAPLLIRNYRALVSGFRDQNREIYRADLRVALIFAVVSTGAFYGLLIEMTVRALNGAATLGDVAVFFGASARLRSGLQSGVDSLTGLLKESLHLSTLMEFLEHTPPPSVRGQPVPPGRTGAITVEDVDFAYPGSSELVLRGLSLEIRPGEAVALVGENGCGKTTLVKLIARLYSPTRGRITFDGCDLEQLDIRSLQRQIAFVFQNFNRYEASAADNIAYGDWEQCLGNRSRIEDIARAAGVHDMISAMPEGYDTLLGRTFGTFDLSGGQWQKLVVARAFARPSSLLILDEPTAALDVRAEHELFVRARTLARGRTTILISHRFTTVSMADRILVMDQGHIIEQGSHDQLLRRAGHYAELYGLHQHQQLGSV